MIPPETEDENQLILESEVVKAKKNLEAMRFAENLFARLAWSFWGSFFTLVILVFGGIDRDDIFIYVGIITICAVATYWWGRIMSGSVVIDAERDVKIAMNKLDKYLHVRAKENRDVDD